MAPLFVQQPGFAATASGRFHDFDAGIEAGFARLRNLSRHGGGGFPQAFCATLPCMSDVKMAPLTVRVMPSLRQRFKLVCVRQERTMNDVLVEFIAWYTERKEQDDGDK